MCKVVVVGKGDSRTEGDEALALMTDDREGNDDMDSRFSWRDRLLVDELPLMPWLELPELLLALLLLSKVLELVVEGGRFLRLLMIS